MNAGRIYEESSSLCVASDYSLAEHLAKIAGGSGWRQVSLAMFTAYFDASGDNSSRYVVAVCGFVASADAWIEWERRWMERLRESHLDALHMKDLNKADYGNAVLIENLCRIIREHVDRKFGVVVVNREIGSALSESDQRRLKVNSYAVAGRTAAKDLRLWASRWAGPFPEMVFEKGDAGESELRHLLTSQGYPEPHFRPKKAYTDKRSGIVHQAVVPLQAADLFANLQFCNIRDCAINKTLMERLPSDLDKIPGDVGLVEADRYELLKQGIEESENLVMVPTVKINVKPGEPTF